MDAFVTRTKVKSAAAAAAPSINHTSKATTEGEEPLAKRVKRDHEPVETKIKPLRPSIRSADEIADSESEGDVSDHDEERSRPTAIESSLPDIKPDEAAIEEYRAFRASQGDKPDNAASRLDNRNWVRGKSSIYVDAFNLALDTVLDQESHLFDGKERVIFDQWKSLNYESQFL
jgi:fanconi-associated nuclease 1